MAKFDYKSALRELRGKIAFDYPLNRRLSPGQKSAIRRAYNSYSAVSKTSIRPLEIKRRRGESMAQYGRRFRKTKRELMHGLAADEQGRMLATASKFFILFDAPPGAKLTYRRNRVILHDGNYVETYIPFTRDFGLDPVGAVYDALLRGMRARIKPTAFNLANGPFRWKNNLSLLSWYENTLGDRSRLYDYVETAMSGVLTRMNKYSKARISNSASGIWLLQY